MHSTERGSNQVMEKNRVLMYLSVDTNFPPPRNILYLRVTASKDRAKLEIDPKIKILKLCQNKAYHKPD